MLYFGKKSDIPKIIAMTVNDHNLCSTSKSDINQKSILPLEMLYHQFSINISFNFGTACQKENYS